MTNAQYKELIDFIYSNDCWFESACEYFGFPEYWAKKAEARFNKEVDQILAS